MSRQAQAQLDRHMDRVEKRLPRRPAKMLRHLRQTGRFLRALGGGARFDRRGFFGFLPILGFWMLPLGLILIAQDVPILQRPLARLLGFIERKWQAWKKR